MARYVLRHRGTEPQARDVELIEQSEGVEILDRGPAGTMLIEASEQAVRELQERLTDWAATEEVTFGPPGPARERIRDDDPEGTR